jgi:hypothetical protein
MRVARWYCPAAQMTFSLLPDCLSSRLGGSLDDAEGAVVASESLGVEAAAQALGVDEIELPGALRWLRRRRRGVRAAVLALVTAMPGRLGIAKCGRSACAGHRACARGPARDWAITCTPCRPDRLRPPCVLRAEGESRHQHETGPDPPA